MSLPGHEAVENLLGNIWHSVSRYDKRLVWEEWAD